jgi:Lamin Tail Domain
MNKLFTLLLLCIITSTTIGQVRISQAYGGGGNTGATYNQDFVEIFNAGTSSVTLNTHSVQYASATGPSGVGDWSVAVIPDGTTIGAGKYFLVALATGANGIALPTADLTVTTVNLSGSAGKVALVSSITPLNGTTACSNANVVDVLGYGTTATCSETAVFVSTGITTAQSIQRKSNGCTDANNNSTDFILGTVAPRNSSSASNLCVIAPVLSVNGVTGLTTPVGSPSAAVATIVSGADLSGFPGNITVTSGSTNIEISLSSSTGFGPTVTLPYTSATLANTNVYVRISATAPLGAVTTTLTVSGGGAPNATANVSGNVVVAEPTVQATNVIISNIANNSVDVNCTNGNGAARIIVVRQTATTAIAPTDAVAYIATTDVTTAATTGAGNFVVYSAAGTGPVSITGLIAGTNYTIQAYEYNGTAATINYLTSAATGNPATVTTTGISPNLAQINFTSESTPLYMGSGTTTRIPVLFYATVSNLLPNTVYKYYTQGAINTDLSTSNSGAGNPILIDYTAGPITYAYSSSPSLNTAGGYGKFRTDATGRFTGTFGFVHSGNARYVAGASIYPTITLAEEMATTTQYRFALNQTITVLTFASTAGAFNGSFLQGASSATPGNLVALWDNTTATGRPLAITLAENPTFTGTAWAGSFVTGYSLTPGSWNTIIPNTNANGVRLVQQINIVTGAIVGCNADADGTWPTGTVVTANPLSGVTPLVIAAADAPIVGGACFNIVPVTLEYITAQKINAGNSITWKVGCLSTSIVMEVQRSADVRNFTSINTITATQLRCYQAFNYIDATPIKGKSFYRIKIIDIDGSISYSPIVAVLNNASGIALVGIYPTLVKQHAAVSIASNKATQVQIVITSINGATVYTSKHNIAAGSNFIPVDCSKLAAGMYNATVITAEATPQNIQFIKQ